MSNRCKYKGKEMTTEEQEYYSNLDQFIEKDLIDSDVVKLQGLNNFKILDEDKLKQKQEQYFKTYGTKVFTDLGTGYLLVNSSNVSYASHKADFKNISLSKYNPDTEIKLQNTKDVVKAINQRLNNAVNSVAKSTKESKVQFREEVKKLQDDLNKLADKDNVLAIRNYVSSSLSYAERTMDYLQITKSDLDNGEYVSISNEMLEEIENNNMLYSLLTNIKETIDNKDFRAELALQDIDFEEFLLTIEEAVSAQDRIKQLRIELGRYHIANKLTPYSDKMLVTYRQRFEERYRREIPIEQGESLKDYNSKINKLVSVELEKYYADIQKEERKLIFNRLHSSPFDIGYLASWVNSEKDLNSEIIQLASKLLDESDLLRDKEVIDYRIDAAKIFQEFNKEVSGFTAQEKYKGLYELGSDGKLYLTGKYNVEWYIQNAALQQKFYEAVEKHGDKSDEVKAASKARDDWAKLNSTKNQYGEVTPKKQWLNKDYESIMKNKDSGKAKMLEFLTESSIQNDKKLYGHLSLIKGISNSTEVFIQLPSIGKNTFEKIDENLGNNIKDSFTSIFQTKADTTEFGQQIEKTGSKDFYKALTDIEGNEKSGVPIHFRGQMSEKDISYDLLSSITMDTFMAENYKHKVGLSAELELLKDIVAEKSFDKTQGILKKYLATGLNKNEIQKISEKDGSKSNEYKVLSSIMENRLYGKTTLDSSYAQLANSLMKWTANTMLMLNYTSGIVNAVQGQVYLFIEGIGGSHFGVDNIKKAEQAYFKDLGNLVGDIGKSVQFAKTNQLIDLLNIQGSMQALSNKFIEDNRVKALFKSNSAYGLSHMGEHYIHGVLMYAIMDRIKVLNKAGNFIDKDGNETTEDKAMSLSEAFSTDKDNKLQLNKHAYKTTHGNQKLSLDNLKDDKSLLETKQLVNKVAHDLYGNYNTGIQSMLQRRVEGKILTMLRKWVVPGFNKRWRGTAKTFQYLNKKDWDTLDTLGSREEKDLMYSEDLKSLEEGYYSTGIRFTANYLKAISQDLKLLSFYGSKQVFSSLSAREQQNVIKFATEMAVIVLTYLLSNLLYSLAEGLPEDSDERAALFYGTYIVRRMYSETATFMNPLEAYRIASNPAASLSFIRKTINLADQLVTDTSLILSGEEAERYERTKRKGQLKLQKRITDVIPITSQLNTDIEEKTSWIFNLN